MNIGKTIRSTRIAQKLKQETVAKVIGISVTAYGDIERGKTKNITLPRLEQIANALKVPVAGLIC